MYSNYDSERAENNIKFCLNFVSTAAIKYPAKTNLGGNGFISAQFQVTVHQDGGSHSSTRWGGWSQHTHNQEGRAMSAHTPMFSLLSHSV